MYGQAYLEWREKEAALKPKRNARKVRNLTEKLKERLALYDREVAMQTLHNLTAVYSGVSVSQAVEEQ